PAERLAGPAPGGGNPERWPGAVGGGMRVRYLRRLLRGRPGRADDRPARHLPRRTAADDQRPEERAHVRGQRGGRDRVHLGHPRRLDPGRADRGRLDHRRLLRGPLRPPAAADGPARPDRRHRGGCRREADLLLALRPTNVFGWTWTMPLLPTRQRNDGWRAVAGPCTTDPSLTRNVLPCQGQVTQSSPSTSTT